jgi:uncharacterized protein YbaP (TraB family)
MEDPALRTSSAFRGSAGAAIATTLLFAACGALHSVPPLRTDNVLFWRVRGPETVNSEAYLLGSVHVGRADRPLVLDQRLAEAFAAATELWVEVDPRELDPAYLLFTMQLYGTLAPKQSITSLLTPETTERLQRYLHERGGRIENVRAKPWLVSMGIIFAEQARVGIRPELGVDRWFIDHAGDKHVAGIETLDSQISAINDLPDELQDLMLRQTLINLKRLDETTESILSSWERGDEAAMAQLMLADPAHPEFEALTDKLIFERNEEMARSLEWTLRTPGTRFVVVGAGHVIGDRGIPAILARHGYSVSPVLPSGAPTVSTMPAATAPPLQVRDEGAAASSPAERIRCICQKVCEDYLKDKYTGEHPVVDGKPACGCKEQGVVVLKFHVKSCD